MSEVKNNFYAIQENIENLKTQKNITQPISVVGVTKKQPLDKIEEGIKAGLRILGINYTQQGLELFSQINNNIEFHFIGHIQSRKVKYLPQYNCIQSIDRLEIAQELNNLLIKLNKKIPVLVEINIGNELQKSGINPSEIETFFNELSHFSNIELVGIMSMPPQIYPIDSRRKYFSKLRTIFEDNKTRYNLKILSMGTSEDYLEAIEEGSNMIRLGTILFGVRS